MRLRSEGDTYAQAHVAHSFRVVGQDVAPVGAVVVVGGHVQARTVGPGIDVQAYFGRDVEAPGFIFRLEDVEVGGQTGVLGAYLHRKIGLAGAPAVPRVTAGHTKGQPEGVVLLVGAETFCGAESQSRQGDVFVVGVPSYEQAEAPVIVQVIAAFGVYAPPTGMVGEAVAHGEVVLPVHAGVAVIGHLRPCRQGGCQHEGYCRTDAFP